MHDQYLYRFDEAAALRKQRRTDKVLRGRRLTGNESEYPHHQVRTAHHHCGEGEAVFRLSFWTCFDALRMRLWERGNAIIQRVRADHPVLQGVFSRGADEYLVNEAWLFWATLKIDPKRTNWSPVGVDHADIEVLHPNGTWLSMDAVPSLNDAAEPGWETYWITRRGFRYPMHAAHRELRTGEQAILLRQPSGPWPTSLSLASDHQHLVQHIVNTKIEQPVGIRWFYSLESDDRVHAQEFFPLVAPYKVPGFKGTWERLRGIKPDHKWEVGVPDDTRTLSKAEMTALYDDFRIADALLRGKKWKYPDLVPSIEEMERLRATFDSCPDR